MVSGRSATVEWQGTGPSADNKVQNFQCSLNGGTRHSCKPILLYYVFVQLLTDLTYRCTVGLFSFF